jgi:outer membrane receptor protein involved in Fe transport
MPMPGEARAAHLAFEAGANDFYRLRGELPFDKSSRYLVSAVYADDGGFREDSGHRQAKLHFKARGELFNGKLVTGLTITDLDQETAGFILGQDAYKDPTLNRANLNPEAFRDARSQRLYGIWSRSSGDTTLDIRPYVRHSDMDFLQHFLPGKPLEENGHSSAGVISTITLQRKAATVVVGADLEYSDAWLRQTQSGPTEGSAFLQETRPEGKHYDYDVSTFSVAPFLQVEWRASDRLKLHGGLRLEHLRHDYSNNMLVGNTRDDGTVCGFGGCLYTRPADRSDSFVDVAPKLAASFDINDQLMLYANLARGFRAPQATELYRLQDGQAVADLDSEHMDSLEVGLRAVSNGWLADLSAYAMRKRNSVLRDAEGFNVSSGRSRHSGLEARLEFGLRDTLSLSTDLSYGRHTYDFNLVAARGEAFVSGRDIDTAPRWLGNVELLWQPNEKLAANLQWTAIGDYYLDAENRFTYPGHELLNLRLRIEASTSLDIVARLNNITDEAIADRADYAFGNYRYFPGRGRELFIEFRYTRSESL